MLALLLGAAPGITPPRVFRGRSLIGLDFRSRWSPVFCGAGLAPVDADRLAARPSMNLVSTQQGEVREGDGAPLVRRLPFV